MMSIARNNDNGNAEYCMTHGTDRETVKRTDTQNRPIPAKDNRDVPFPEWCTAHRHQLRRMVRFICSRHGGQVHGQVQGDGDLIWDWDGLESSLARYAYSTSANRRKATPSII